MLNADPEWAQEYGPRIANKSNGKGRYKILYAESDLILDNDGKPFENYVLEMLLPILFTEFEMLGEWIICSSSCSEGRLPNSSSAKPDIKFDSRFAKKLLHVIKCKKLV